MAVVPAAGDPLLHFILRANKETKVVGNIEFDKVAKKCLGIGESKVCLISSEDIATNR